MPESELKEQLIIQDSQRHFDSLAVYLESHIQKEQTAGSIGAQRQSARDKLMKLNNVQFHELSTDVYDEMNRRTKDSEDVPFLPVQPEFHPKRNQARQKLATLPVNRFKDLASDVYHELLRRYGERFAGMARQVGSSAPAVVPVAVPRKQEPVVQQDNSGIATPPKQPSAKSLAPINTGIGAQIKATGQPQAQQQQTLNKPIVPPKKEEQLGPSKSQENINFASLDNLMADLGSMLHTGGHSTTTTVTEFDNHQRPVEKQQPQQQFERQQQPQQPQPQPLSRNPSTGAQKQISQQKPSGPSAAETELRESLARSMRDNENLQESLRLKQSQLDKLNAENQDLGKKLLTAEDQLTVGKSEVLRLRADVERYLVERKQSDERIQELHGRVSLLEIEQRNVEKLKTEAAELKTQIASLQLEKEEVLELMKTLEQDNQQVKEELKTERKAVDKFRAELEHAHALTHQLETDKQALERQLADRDQQIQKLVAEKQQQKSPVNNNTVTVSKVAVAPTAAPIEQLTNSQIKQQPPPFDSIPAKIDLEDQTIYEPAGQMNFTQIQSFKDSILALLKSSRATDNPANVLIAMKSVVVTTRALLDSLATVKTDNTIAEAVNLLQSNIGQHLNALMDVSKQHATSGKADPTRIDVATDELVIDVVSVLHLLKIKRSDGTLKQPAIVENASVVTPSPNVVNNHNNSNSNSSNTKQASAKDYSIDSLKIFLEQQTDLIVQNIQVLLMAMRNSTFGPEFKNIIDGISGVVTNLIQVSRTSLSKQQSTVSPGLIQKSSNILGQLEDSNLKLVELGQTLMGTQKPSKQRLAAAAYEVAKFTKELVSLFDLDR